MRKFMTKRVYIALSVVAVLAITGSAIAYFTSSGTGTGNGTVGTASAWAPTQTGTTGTMYPGTGSSTIAYVVKNTSPTANQGLNGTTAVVASSGANITSGGVAVPGCLAADFTAVNTAPTPLPQNVAPLGNSSAGSVLVTMANTLVSQDACQGKTPDITISAS